MPDLRIFTYKFIVNGINAIVLIKVTNIRHKSIYVIMELYGMLFCIAISIKVRLFCTKCKNW